MTTVLSRQKIPPNQESHHPTHRGGPSRRRNSYHAISELHFTSNPHTAACAASMEHIFRCGNLFEIGRVYGTEWKARSSSMGNHAQRRVKQLFLTQCSDTGSSSSNKKKKKFSYGVIMSECGNGINTAQCEALNVDDEEDEILRWKYSKGQQVLKGSNYSLLGDDSSFEDDDDDDLTLNTDGWSWTRYSHIEDHSTIATFTSHASSSKVSSLRIRMAQTIDDSESNSLKLEDNNRDRVTDSMRILAVTSFEGETKEEDENGKAESSRDNDNIDAILEEAGVAFEPAFKSDTTHQSGRMTPSMKGMAIEEAENENDSSVSSSHCDSEDAPGKKTEDVESTESVAKKVLEKGRISLEQAPAPEAEEKEREKDQKMTNEKSCAHFAEGANIPPSEIRSVANLLDEDIEDDGDEKDNEVNESSSVPSNDREVSRSESSASRGKQDVDKAGSPAAVMEHINVPTETTYSDYCQSSLSVVRHASTEITSTTDQWLHRAIQAEESTQRKLLSNAEQEKLVDDEVVKLDALNMVSETTTLNTEADATAPMQSKLLEGQPSAMWSKTEAKQHEIEVEMSATKASGRLVEGDLEIEVSVCGDAMNSAMVSVAGRSHILVDNDGNSVSLNVGESNRSTPTSDDREPKNKRKGEFAVTTETDQREESEIAELEIMALQNMEVGSVNGAFCDISVMTEEQEGQSQMSGNQSISKSSFAELADDWASVGESKRQRSSLSFNSFFRRRSDASVRSTKPLKISNLDPEKKEEFQMKVIFDPKEEKQGRPSHRDPTLPPLPPRKGVVGPITETSSQQLQVDENSGYEVLEGLPTTSGCHHVHVLGVGGIETSASDDSKNIVRTKRFGIANKLIQLATGNCGGSHTSSSRRINRKKLSFTGSATHDNDNRYNVKLVDAY